MACLTAVMEDLQWFDASLVMSEVMRTYNGGTPHSLLDGGEGEGGSSPAMSPSQATVWGPLSFSFGGSSGSTEVNFTRQQL